jgi:hypothetical protein
MDRAVFRNGVMVARGGRRLDVENPKVPTERGWSARMAIDFAIRNVRLPHSSADEYRS